MREPKHTKGPWRVVGDFPIFVQTTYLAPHNPKIGELTICQISAQADQTVANARLIAAAPELLEALNAVTRQAKLARPSSLMVPLLDDADEAIAKAEGRQ